MARPRVQRKYDDQTKIEALELLSSGYSIRQAGSKLGIPPATLQKWRTQNKDTPQYKIMQNQARGVYLEGAFEILQDAMAVLKRQFSRAKHDEQLLDLAIQKLATADMTKTEINAAIKVINDLRLIKPADIMPVINTLSDKMKTVASKERQIADATIGIVRLQDRQ